MNMIYVQHYMSPLGGILISADVYGLTGLWFEGQKYFGAGLSAEISEQNTPALDEAVRWLDVYFSGRDPGFTPPLHPAGTAFREAVWKILLSIPYGQIMTYGQIAAQLSQDSAVRMSAQAVGGAVGHNAVSLIIPCHRVVGTDGSLTGYAGGVDKKAWLLRHEKVDFAGHKLYVPQKGTAL